jgi:hypothetical protein
MEKMELFNVLRRSMNIEEGTEVWKIAPKLDEEGLRNAYLENYVYEVGNIVENMNTGFRGEVIRRGTNYVICVTEDGMMFKSWLRDLIENPHEIRHRRIPRISSVANSRPRSYELHWS